MNDPQGANCKKQSTPAGDPDTPRMRSTMHSQEKELAHAGRGEMRTPPAHDVKANRCTLREWNSLRGNLSHAWRWYAHYERARCGAGDHNSLEPCKVLDRIRKSAESEFCNRFPPKIDSSLPERPIYTFVLNDSIEDFRAGRH